MIQRLENQVRSLPEEVIKQEGRLATVHQKVEDAREALGVPFKHQDALDAARWEVERIDRAMRGEKTPQPSLDSELEALKKRMRLESPQSSNGHRGSPQRSGSPVRHSPEVSRRHDEQRAQEDGLGL